MIGDRTLSNRKVAATLSHHSGPRKFPRRLTPGAFVALIESSPPPFIPIPFMETIEDLNAIDTNALKGRLGELRRYL
jgi:hypothetical protein